MKIYVVRHGETDWNNNGIMQGNTDVLLNQTGIEQGLKVKKILENERIDICMSSPLKRAYDTAKIICNPTLLRDSPC